MLATIFVQMFCTISGVFVDEFTFISYYNKCSLSYEPYHELDVHCKLLFFLSSMQTFFWFNHVEKMFGYGHVFVPTKMSAYFLLLCFLNDKDIYLTCLLRNDVVGILHENWHADFFLFPIDALL